MRRKGLKIVPIILTSISILILICTYVWTIGMFQSIHNQPETDGLNYGGIIYLFGLIMLMCLDWISISLNIPCIVMTSIDIKKTKMEYGSIKLSLTFLIINIVLLIIGIAAISGVQKLDFIWIIPSYFLSHKYLVQ